MMIKGVVIKTWFTKNSDGDIIVRHGHIMICARYNNTKQ